MGTVYDIVLPVYLVAVGWFMNRRREQRITARRFQWDDAEAEYAQRRIKALPDKWVVRCDACGFETVHLNQYNPCEGLVAICGCPRLLTDGNVSTEVLLKAAKVLDYALERQ